MVHLMMDERKRRWILGNIGLMICGWLYQRQLGRLIANVWMHAQRKGKPVDWFGRQMASMGDAGNLKGGGDIRIEVQSIAPLGFLGFRGWAEAFAIDENGRLVPSMSRAGTSRQLGGHVGPMRTYTQTIRANFRARAFLWRVHLRATRQATSGNAPPFFFRVFR